MKQLLLALQFLTIIPLRVNNCEKKDFGGSLIYFPVIGLLIAFILTLGLVSFQALGFRGIALSVFLVILLTIITGGLHLDGLADTTDSLYGGRNKDDILSIMRDPHIGTMGVLAIFCVIFLKISLFYSQIEPLRIKGLFLMCLLSRWSMVMLIFSFPYARKEGKALVFLESINLKIFLMATGITGISAFLIWQIKGLIIWALIAGCALLFGKITARKIEGITGDTLGAANELIEVICLFFIYIIGTRVPINL